VGGCYEAAFTSVTDIERKLIVAASARVLPAVTIGSTRKDRSDGERNVALIKEGESESPEIIAVIERNREDRERIVVIDP
jgi:hypothetical protein